MSNRPLKVRGSLGAWKALEGAGFAFIAAAGCGWLLDEVAGVCVTADVGVTGVWGWGGCTSGGAGGAGGATDEAGLGVDSGSGSMAHTQPCCWRKARYFSAVEKSTDFLTTKLRLIKRGPTCSAVIFNIRARLAITSSSVRPSCAPRITPR